MVQTCSRCSRANPPEASYCWFDGALLAGHVAGDGVIRSGKQPFPSPFVFPSGQQCQNFDQLALALHANWAEATELLKKGFLEAFLGGLGRADLAQAAKEAARFPDPDRGLDQLLGRLPTDVLEPARLKVEPQEFNLGQVRIAENRTLHFTINNEGKRLLYGTVTCENSPWLALGDGETQEKVFETTDTIPVPLRIRGKYLRASSRPIEGRLTIESNGGTATIVVRAEVPAKPFPDGVLAGARSPRQLAEKARAFPKEAAVFFENGAVERWYKDNGWVYPVRTPSASGLAAVQQFFEALGLVKPPKVDIDVKVINFIGNAGDQLEYTLKVETPEKRPVYAHAVSDCEWLKPEKPQLAGRVATIPVRVPAVPSRYGETLRGKLTVVANGNQRFVVPVALSISETGRPPAPAVGRSGSLAAIRPQTPWAQRIPLPKDLGTWVHATPVALLLLVLLAFLLRDALFSPEDYVLPGGGAMSNPGIAIHFHDRGDPHVKFDTMTFGLEALGERDPTDPRRFKRLTYDARGRSNNTVLKIDGQEFIFGRPPGRWLIQKEPLPPAPTHRRDGYRSVWSYDAQKIVVSQIVERVLNEQTQSLDTCLARYLIENKDSQPHIVGLRFLLDTYIGANDGVPFTIPGQSNLCSTSHDFKNPEEVPDFIQALEFDNLERPGTVAHLQLRLGGRLEPPSRVTLGAWPNDKLPEMANAAKPRGQNTLWEVPVLDIRAIQNVRAGEPADSAVVIYWAERSMNPGEAREMGFKYGLGNLAGSGGKLGLTAGGSFAPGGVFTLTALVREPNAGETVTLTVPEGLQLVKGEATQKVPALPEVTNSRNSPVTWRLKSSKQGKFVVRVQSSTGATQSLTVTIRTSRIFD
ncbi:MAG: hypothetical protein NZ700_07070 [Gemmataceae bacterium]|nr:hypothetical protein [Gemmataceae bacterium]MDW8266646.1 hypothetical protein [Gemmataceae bacterium]